MVPYTEPVDGSGVLGRDDVSDAAGASVLVGVSGTVVVASAVVVVCSSAVGTEATSGLLDATQPAAARAEMV
jgi:hypothetical protein